MATGRVKWVADKAALESAIFEESRKAAEERALARRSNNR